jgi:hypothetical protein
LVERKHVRQAAKSLFKTAVVVEGARGAPPHCLFISLSHEDGPFAEDLTQKLDAAGLTYCKADRDIQLASDWAEATWDLIRGCSVFLCVVTPRFLKSRWFLLEAGAACACKKRVVLALRHVETKQVPEPLDRFQSMTVENNQQLDTLIKKLRRMCRG